MEPMLILAVVAVCAEAFVAIAIWSERWRPTAFVVALGLHLSLAAWFSPTYPLIIFAVAMLPLLVLFLDAAPGRVVVWDDGCGFCATWVKWFRRLDWLDTLRFVSRSELPTSGLPVSEDAAARALQIVWRNEVHGGFAAVTPHLRDPPDLLPLGPAARACRPSPGPARSGTAGWPCDGSASFRSPRPAPPSSTATRTSTYLS